MIVTLSINGRPMSVNDEAEINQQITRRRDEGVSVCVKAEVRSDGLHIVLGTASCGAYRGGRQANDREQRFFDLWRQLGLADENFSGGQVIAFLRQVQRLA